MRKSYRGDREVQPLPPGHEKGVSLRLGASVATYRATGFRDHGGGKTGFQRQQLERKT